MKSLDALTIGRLPGLTAFLATVTVMPWIAYEPINVPKLAVISAGGFMALGAILANHVDYMQKQYRTLLIIGLAFIIDLTLVLIISGTNFNQEFFGTFGRATGYLAYLALTFLLITAAITANSFTLHRFVGWLLGAGFISIIYGVIQTLKLDPINWLNQYSPVIGFLGNPNFQSSFVGLSGVMAFAMLIGDEVAVAYRAGYVLYIVLAAYVIQGTLSQQGFFVLTGGISVVTFIRIVTSKVKSLSFPFSLLGLVGAVLVVAGTLKRGPLAAILYEDSVTYRGDYWRAGWKMSMENPFFGVGLDSYGDWYRRARTAEATLRRGPDIVSNAAHNVLLDLSSNGGFPLMIIYLFLMLLVAVSTIKVIKRNSGFNPAFSGLVAVWVAYQAQSIISLNQLGLAIWGWIISGLIIGYEINTREFVLIHKRPIKTKSARVISNQKIMPKTILGMFIGLMVGIALGAPTLITASKYKSGLETGDANIVQNIANSWPQDASRSVKIAIILQENKLQEQALDVIEEASRRFPDSFDVWKVLASLEGTPKELVAEAKTQMKRLDPYNPTLK